MFFAYQQMFDGRWIPIKSLSRPADRGVNGHYAPVKRIVELPEEEVNWSLQELARKYSISEKNNGTTSSSSVSRNDL